MSLSDVGLSSARVKGWIAARDRRFARLGHVDSVGEALTKGIVGAAFCMDERERASILAAPAIIRRPRWALRAKARLVERLLAAGVRPAHAAKAFGVSRQAMCLRRATDMPQERSKPA